jgi:type I restriction enzyme, S subunit
MNNQIEITFGKIGRAITGKTPSSNDPEDFGEGFPFVTPTDSLDSKYVLHTARQLSNEGLRKLKSKALPPNSVLVSCIGSAMGKVVMNSTTCITNQQFNSIIVDTNRFCPHYIYYALRNSYKLLRNAASGSTALPMLNKTDFEKLQIRVFKDKAQQRKIAAVLSTLDAKIALNHRINGELEGLAKLCSMISR